MNPVLKRIAIQKPNNKLMAFCNELKLRKKSLCVLVMGDSTSNNDGDWYYPVIHWIGSLFKGYGCRYRLWDDTVQGYGIFVNMTGGGNAGFGNAVFSGASGSYIYTQNKAALNITSDIDIWVKASRPAWTDSALAILISKFGVAGSRGWYFGLNNGYLYFQWSPDGTNLLTAQSTSKVSFTNNAIGGVRVTVDVDNGSGGYDIKFYVSDNFADWTQLGDTVTGGTTTVINNNTYSMELGGRNSGSSGYTAHTIYQAYVKNGIGGKIVASPDFGAAHPAGISSFNDGEGNVWNIVGSVTVGNGSPCIYSMNASTPGQVLSYSTDATRFELQTPIEPQIVFINYSHNEGSTTDYTAAYETLCDKIIAKHPKAYVVCVTQNPETSPAVNIEPHRIRNQQIAELAKRRGFGLIDAYSAFSEAGGNNMSTFVSADGIHPTATGFTLWSETAKKWFRKYGRITG